MNNQVSAETIQLLKEANRLKTQDDLAKAFTQATGLVNFDLERPAKLIYPVITPLRNMIPRVKGDGGTATNWRAVTGINTTNQSPGVSEGNRSGVISTEVKSYVAVFKTLGLEDFTTFEGQFASEGFDDAIARMVEGLLRSTMISEEQTDLGGNTSLALGQAGTPVLADLTAQADGTIAAGTTVHVSAIPLTNDGVRTATVNGVQGQVTRVNADATQDVFGGFSGQISAAQNITVAADADPNHVVTAQTTQIPGAMGYGWFVGPTAGAAQTFFGISTINSIRITSTPGAGTQNATDATIQADNSTNALLYDGIISLIFGAGQENPAAASSGALISVQPNGPSGTGTPLTPDGAGGVVEINDDLKKFWDDFRLSPTHLIVNSQELQNITKAVIGGGAASLFRFNLDNVQQKAGQALTAQDLKVYAGTTVGWYLNKNTMGGGQLLKVVLHPDLAPGTIIYYSDQISYPLSNITNILQTKTRREYYQIDWPLRTRKYEKGTYCDKVLQMYFPPAFGARTNIANG